MNHPAVNRSPMRGCAVFKKVRKNIFLALKGSQTMKREFLTQCPMRGIGILMKNTAQSKAWDLQREPKAAEAPEH